MELTLNKQKIHQEFIPKEVILFNNELMDAILNDFINNEIIGYSPEEKRTCDYTKEIEFSVNRGGLKHDVIIDYKFDFAKHRNDEVDWLSISIGDKYCYVNEGRYEGEEVTILTPFWNVDDTTELEQSIIKHYNS